MNHGLMTPAPRSLLFLAMGFLAASLSVTALGQPSAASQPVAAPINKMCPVLQDQAADPAITTVYKGRTIAFCCSRCRRKFEADPEAYVAHLAAFTPPGSQPGPAETEEPDHHEHEPGEAVSHTGHSHAGSDEEPVPLFARMHPVIVHFPVAGVPLALLAFLTWLATGKQKFAAADVPPLFVAALAAVLAFFSGHLAADHTRFSASMHEIVERHEFAGTTLMIVVLCLTVFRIWRWNRLTGRWRWIYAGGLFVAVGVAVITGYLGGSLVFGPDHFSF